MAPAYHPLGWLLWKAAYELPSNVTLDLDYIHYLPRVDKYKNASKMTLQASIFNIYMGALCHVHQITIGHFIMIII